MGDLDPETIVAMAEALYGLSTTAPPRARAWGRWMRAVEPGHLVVIHHVRGDAEPGHRVGRLRWSRRGTHGIVTLDGVPLTWDNVLVLRVPERAGDGPPGSLDEP